MSDDTRLTVGIFPHFQPLECKALNYKMKIENEVERTKKRITLLETQNARFRKLLESAAEVTSKANSTTNLVQDESKFWQETIELIENEKVKLQEDLHLLSAPQDEISLAIKKLETENWQLQKKVDVLLEQIKLQEKQMEKMKTEHAEIKFLLSGRDTNAAWFKKIWQLDDTLQSNSSVPLLEERHKLQRKVLNLEKKKYELLNAIEEIIRPESSTKADGASIKSDLEKALFNAIDEVAKREFESLHLKALDLEKERSDLLTELQVILDSSRRKIAEEYCKLQLKILEIERERFTSSKLSISVINPTVSDEELNHVLDAFSNKREMILNTPTGDQNLQETVENQYKLLDPTCSIL